MTAFYIDTDRGHDAFSWTPCEICGSHLGGERYYAVNMADPEDVREVCIDCVERIEYA